MSDYDTLKEQFTIPDLWRRLGLPGDPPDRDNVKFSSPFREDKNPPCSFSEGQKIMTDWSRNERYDLADVYVTARGIEKSQGPVEVVKYYVREGAFTSTSGASNPRASNPRKAKVAPSSPEQIAAALDAYYCNHHYYTANGDGTYLERNEDQLRRVMVIRKAATSKESQDALLYAIEEHRNVDWAGEVAGYQAGKRTFETKKFLVTSGPNIIKARKRLCEVHDEILGSLLEPDSLALFEAWLKLGREALALGVPRPGQVLILCAPQECGKSITQKLIITPMLGGRSAKCYKYMTGKTGFNADLAGAEHWTIDDEIPLYDPRARRAVGHHFTQVTSHDDLRAEAKYRPAFNLPQFTRLSVSCNDTEEHMKVLPPLDDLLRKKVIMLRTKKGSFRFPSNAREYLGLQDILQAERDGYAYRLDHLQIPLNLLESRYGVVSYQDPELLEILAGTVHDFDAMELARDAIDNCKGGSGFDPYQEHGKDTTAEKLYKLIWNTEYLKDGLRRLCTSPRSLGRILHRLIDQDTPGLSMRTLHSKSLYTIEPEKDEQRGG
jgi:hypothetical protein